MKIRTYSELKRIETFEDRYRYLKLAGVVGAPTFGYERILNQLLYTSDRWRSTRSDIIIRDNGCDLGVKGYKIHSGLLVHHMNPITIEDIEEDRDHIYDPEFLITTVLRTHNAIHYGNENQIAQKPIERRPGDTRLW